MIYEMRTYTTPPGQAPALAKLSSEVGRPIRGDDYGKLEGYWLTEIGPLNQVMHLWSFDDLNHRQERRTALSQNESWTGDYVAQAAPIILKQEIRLLNPIRPISPPTTEGNIYEYRYYRCKVGKAKAMAEALNEAMVHREKYSKNVGIWLTEASQPNEVSHLWAYESLNHRAEARAGAAADPGWQAMLKANGPRLEEMSSLIMVPSSTSPLK